MNAPIRFRIDWTQILFDLNRQGYSLAKISYFTGIPQPNLHTYRDRDLPREPLHYNGELLRKFWCETMGRTDSDLPLVAVTPRLGSRRR